jgi:hypothetical protein
MCCFVTIVGMCRYVSVFLPLGIMNTYKYLQYMQILQYLKYLQYLHIPAIQIGSILTILYLHIPAILVHTYIPAHTCTYRQNMHMPALG